MLDFGLAKLRGEPALATAGATEPTVTRLPTDRESAATAAGVVMGTVGYMSPEQALGQPVDHRSDIFSFGCILYKAATGARPFSGSSAIDTLHKIIHAQPQAIAQLAPSCPPELQRIVRKCLTKSPDERYQSMKDLVLDVRALLREMDSGSNPTVATAPSRTGVRATRSWLAAAALVVVAGIATVLWLSWRDGRGDEQRVLAFERITASGNVIDAVISGDGKYVAYVESEGGRQSLWLRQLRGGRPLQLAAPDGGFWGVMFSKDATSIYYAVKNPREPIGTLYSIPVLGGSARPLLSGIDSNITFSPDGSRLASYRVNAQPRGTSSLMIAGAAGENPQPLVTKAPPEFFAPGFFIAPAWSPDGAFIAGTIRNSQKRDARLALFGIDDGIERSFPNRYAQASFTAWLPDGSGIVVAALMPGMPWSGNGGQLWIQPYPSGDPRRITSDMLEYRNASLTADGRSLVSVAYEASSRLGIASISGADERRLPEERTAGASGVAWSPDGRQIFYLKLVRDGREVWTMNADGTGARQVVTNARPSGIAVSPDGQWIVYGAEQNDGVGIWRAKVDGSGAQALAAIADPSWLTIAPDGTQIYFTSLRDGSPATYRLSIDGGEPALVAAGLERAVVSPDGRLLAGVYKPAPEAPLSIGVLNASDGKPVNVFPGFAAASGGGGFAWLPDGKTLLYTTAERRNLWKQPAMGGPREQVTNFTDLWIARFALSPDGQTVLFCRGNVLRDAVLLTNFR